MNRNALKMARQVADATNTLMAGNINNTTMYKKDDRSFDDHIREQYKETITWAVEEGADFIIAETIGDYGEAAIALECIKQYAPGKEAVIMISQYESDVKNQLTNDGLKITDALKKLEDAGADVVGLNCSSGPLMLVEIMKGVRGVCKGHLGCLPVPYLTDWNTPRMVDLEIHGRRSFPYNMDSFLCSVDDIVKFGQDCRQNDIKFIGLCCGNTARFTRNLAEALGRKPPASRYSPDMSLHYIYGDANKAHLQSYHTTKLKNVLDSQGDK